MPFDSKSWQQTIAVKAMLSGFLKVDCEDGLASVFRDYAFQDLGGNVRWNESHRTIDKDHIETFPVGPTGVDAEVILPQEIAATSDSKMSVLFEAGGESLWVPMRFQKVQE